MPFIIAIVLIAVELVHMNLLIAAWPTMRPPVKHRAVIALRWLAILAGVAIGFAVFQKGIASLEVLDYVLLVCVAVPWVDYATSLLFKRKIMSYVQEASRASRVLVLSYLYIAATILYGTQYLRITTFSTLCIFALAMLYIFLFELRRLDLSMGSDTPIPPENDSKEEE